MGWGRGRERNYITHNIFPKCAFHCNSFSNTVMHSGSRVKVDPGSKGSMYLWFSPLSLGSVSSGSDAGDA